MNEIYVENVQKQYDKIVKNIKQHNFSENVVDKI